MARDATHLPKSESDNYAFGSASSGVRETFAGADLRSMPNAEVLDRYSGDPYACHDWGRTLQTPHRCGIRDPTILVTAYPNAADRARALNDGVPYLSS